MTDNQNPWVEYERVAPKLDHEAMKRRFTKQQLIELIEEGVGGWAECYNLAKAQFREYEGKIEALTVAGEKSADTLEAMTKQRDTMQEAYTGAVERQANAQRQVEVTTDRLHSAESSLAEVKRRLRKAEEAAARYAEAMASGLHSIEAVLDMPRGD